MHDSALHHVYGVSYQDYMKRASHKPIHFLRLQAIDEMSGHKKKAAMLPFLIAERARFELAERFPLRQFSKLVVSATHPPLRGFVSEIGRKNTLFPAITNSNGIFFLNYLCTNRWNDPMNQ